MSNGGAVLKSSYVRSRRFAIWSLSALLLFSGCEQVTYEKIDHKGHVVVKGDRAGEGYCFQVDRDWEIREKLEGADVVCLAPVKNKFRESIVARSLSSVDLEDPEAALEKQLKALGDKVEIVEPWKDQSHPMLVKLTGTQYSKFELSQLLYLHVNPEGDGVLICATARTEAMNDRREFFDKIVSKVEFDLANCPDPTGVPEVFPTPEVTFSPGPENASAAPVVATPSPAAATTPQPAASISPIPAAAMTPQPAASVSPIPAASATP